jgi:UDP-N-acetyl-alpha-D-muramoyl-L-alanyl-L-glutamate epimerase
MDKTVMAYQRFIFDDYEFNPETRRLELRYGYDDELMFTETFQFDFPFVSFDAQRLDRAIQLLFFLAGSSYYKAHLLSAIEIRKGQIDAPLAEFLSRTYQRGMRELFFINQLDPLRPVEFTPNVERLEDLPSAERPAGKLVGVSGGKDSLVSVEILRTMKDERIHTWSAGQNAALSPLIGRIGLPHHPVTRLLDDKIRYYHKEFPDVFNGHIPLSAIHSAAGVVVAILSGFGDVVVSNESSANEGRKVSGVDINHQYSKSIDFEADFQAALRHSIGDQLRFYSLLRPYCEVRIAELFSRIGFHKYRDVFCSCNQGFRGTDPRPIWCGQCYKCAFIFLALTPFLGRQNLEVVFGDNLLLKPSLEETYRQLLGIELDRPFDCVGGINETRAAMSLARVQYPELSKYRFELSDSYDFRQEGPHLLPADIDSALRRSIADLVLP